MMKNIKIITFNVFSILFFFCVVEAYSQERKLNMVEFTVIAEGLDSPIEDLQIVCFNKHFNMAYLPAKFRQKYNLNRKELFKKNMLIELFHSSNDKNNYVKIELIGIRESNNSIIVEYNLIKSEKIEEEKISNPFLIIQVPKSKKAMKFIVDGVEFSKTTKLYTD